MSRPETVNAYFNDVKHIETNRGNPQTDTQTDTHRHTDTQMNSVHQPDAGLQWVAKGVGQKQTSPRGDHYRQAATWARPLWHGRCFTSNSSDYCMGVGGDLK